MGFLDVIRIIGTRRLAKAAGLSTPNAVAMWRRRGKVPLRHVLAVERLFRRHGYDRYDLAPEVYGPRPKSRKRK